MKKFFSLLSILTLAGCAPSSNEQSQAMETPDEEAMVTALDTAFELFISSYNAGDAEGLSSRFAENAISILGGLPEPLSGRNAIRSHWETFLGPDGPGYQSTENAVRLGHKVLGPDLISMYGEWETVDPDGVRIGGGVWSTVERITDGVAQILLHTSGEFSEGSR